MPVSLARGVDLNDECLAVCRAKGLDAEKADLFQYLAYLPNETLGGAICAQVVEHLPPERVLELVRLLHAKLQPGRRWRSKRPIPSVSPSSRRISTSIPRTRGRSHPRCLASISKRPALPGLKWFACIPRSSRSRPWADLPEAFREQFFGGMDYAIFGRKV